MKDGYKPQTYAITLKQCTFRERSRRRKRLGPSSTSARGAGLAGSAGAQTRCGRHDESQKNNTQKKAT